jgi:hypothetical protein
MSEWTEIERELEWRRCARDETYWLENYWYIKHPERGRILLRLRPAQLETLETWNTQRYSIALKARQIGFSTIGAAHAVWLAFFHPDRFIVMLSRTEREAIKLLAKAKYGYKFLPEWMLARGPRMLDDNLTKMSWGNDSAIESLPSGSDPARGESVYLVIVDEWAFLPNPEEAWASIEPITDIGGRIVGISTANGSGNFFHHFYVAAKTGTSRFKAIFYPWWSASERDQSWYEAKAESMLPWQLHQEYPRDDVECFIKSGNPVFDTDDLEMHDLAEPVWRGFIEGDGSLNPEHRRGRHVEAADGPLQIWAQPVRDGRRYVLGADVAEGLEHGDYSVVWVVDHSTGRTVAKWRGHAPPDVLGHNVIWYLGWHYHAALAGVEVNNHGLTTLVALQNRRYPNIYFRTSYDERTMKRHSKIGWRTQANTKPLLINELAAALRTSSGPELSLADRETLGELQTYVRDADGKMHGSPFDDQVIALGIANQMRKHEFIPQMPEARDRRWTIDWWLSQEEADGGGRREPIGAHNTRGV